MHVFAVAVLVLAIVSATGALASLGGRLSASLDVAAHFTPVWALGAALATSAGLALGSAGRPSAAMGLAGLVACALLMAPELAVLSRRRAAPRPGRTIKVIQLNLWRWNVDADKTVAWLAAQDADIVVVQEVIDRAAGIPAALAQAYPHQVQIRTGTQILSRLPILEHAAHRARSTRTHSTGAWARLDHPFGPFDVFGFQATWPIPPGLQQRDSADIADLLNSFDRRTLIVCGDFNSTPWSAGLRRQDRLFGLERRSRALLTWPVQPYTKFRLTSPLPFLALDHIYAGPAWSTVDMRLGPRLGSDHLPIVAVLTR
ncbi:MAG: endonuclease/exonuclease/phosphatase family protein [Caulobacteraceae bacterium]|nr:endonuclease/exonuclease/phosphatase family protein [Caulobacteraceae bacterium]